MQPSQQLVAFTTVLTGGFSAHQTWELGYLVSKFLAASCMGLGLSCSDIPPMTKGFLDTLLFGPFVSPLRAPPVRRHWEESLDGTQRPSIAHALG